MLEPFQNHHWPDADRRALRIGLSFLILLVGCSLAAWLDGFSWTIQTGIDYIPKEITIEAYEIPSDLVEFSLGLPDYAFGEYITIRKILPPDWIFPVFLIVFWFAISLLSAAVSCFRGIWLYACLTAIAAGVALFEPAFLTPLGFSGKWITVVSVLIVLLPVYIISEWFAHWNLSRRWWIMMLAYALPGMLFFKQGFHLNSCTSLVSAAYIPLLLGAILFLAMNSMDVLHSLVIILTRSQGNAQSPFHFSVFSIAYLSTFLLIYLKNTGQLELDIFYPDPFLLQILLILIGLFVLPAKKGLLGSDFSYIKGYSALYLSLAILFLLAVSMAFGTASDLMVEVLEDAITLVNFCFGFCFFLYVLINFSDLMRLGLKVHEVLFRPRYMPVSAPAVFGIAGIFLFMMNNDYFTFYQAMAGRYVYWADQARIKGNGLEAEEWYRQALAFESRNQRANLSLAMLYQETGNFEKAMQSAQASLEKNPCPEAVMAMAQVYRMRDKTLDEILCLQEGLRSFPNDGRLLNNTGIAFSGTIYPDSSGYYFRKSSEKRETSGIANVNLGFLQLWKNQKKSGQNLQIPAASGDWAGLNNQLVQANISHQKAAAVPEVLHSFSEIPHELQPYLLYHALLNKAINRDTSDFQQLASLENDSIRKDYSEAIQLGKAMLEYRGGKVFTGMNEMLQLYEAGTSNRYAIGLLLGQIYYEQGAYLTAASWYRKAAISGNKNAWYWYAIAMLDAGKGKEAGEAFVEALPFLSPEHRVQVSVLADGLRSGQFRNAALRSDLEKSTFLKVEWARLSNQQIKDLLHLIADRETSRLLWRYSYLRAYRESNQVRCRDLFQYASSFHGSDTRWASLLKEMRTYALEIRDDFPAMEKSKEINSAFLNARLADHSGKNEEALKRYRQAIEEAPLLERQALISVQRMSEIGKMDEAYQKALELSTLEPSSAAFLKLYARMALRMGLSEFAFQCLPKYEMLSSAQEANALRQQMTEELIARKLPVPSIPNP